MFSHLAYKTDNIAAWFDNDDFTCILLGDLFYQHPIFVIVLPWHGQKAVCSHTVYVNVTYKPPPDGAAVKSIVYIPGHDLNTTDTCQTSNTWPPFGGYYSHCDQHESYESISGTIHERHTCQCQGFCNVYVSFSNMVNILHVNVCEINIYQ